MAAPPPPPGGTPSVDHKREPCPHRILDDVGGAYGMGAVGGGLWHALKGAKNSPGGARARGGFEVRAGGRERCWSRPATAAGRDAASGGRPVRGQRRRAPDGRRRAAGAAAGAAPRSRGGWALL
jgi:import inner membrane translocase subunit TIM17